MLAGLELADDEVLPVGHLGQRDMEPVGGSDMNVGGKNFVQA